MITQREISQIAFREGMSDRVIEKDSSSPGPLPEASSADLILCEL